MMTAEMTSAADQSALRRAVVIGAGGYGGAELCEILLGHPHVEIAGLFASARRGEHESTHRMSELFPRFRDRIDLPVQATSVEAVHELSPDVIFLATPHEASHDLAPELLRPGVVVIDLSAAFRFRDPSVYPAKYGFEHRHTALLASAVYGLPEVFRDAIRTAELIASPGCYPTSAILPLRPLLGAGVIDAAWMPIVDSTSGVSGAGRSPVLKTHFCEVSLQPYNVLRHRHQPEISTYAGREVMFTPHLGAYDRGILSTMHLKLADGVDSADVRAILHGVYEAEPFVRLLPEDCWPSVAAVRGTNYCDIGLAVDDRNRHLILVSAIDNLTKGAAGQAVQAMNIRLGFDECTGLLTRTTC